MKTTAANNRKQVFADPAPASEAGTTASRPKGRSWLKSLGFWGGGLAVAGALGLSLLPSPLEVDVAVVERGLLRVTVDEEGRTRVKDRFVVSAPVDGRLQRIPWEPGDRVEAGMLLGSIDALPFQTAIQSLRAEVEEWQAYQHGVETLRPKADTIAQAHARIDAAQAVVQVAEAEVERAAAALAQARRQRQRAQTLEESGVLPREDRELAELTETTRLKEWDMAQKQLQSAQAQVAIAEADLGVLQAEKTDPDYLLQVYAARIAALEAELIRLRDDAAHTEIRSPVAGQILRVLQKSSQVVTAGTPLLELGNPRNLELVIDVLSQDALQIQVGDPVWVNLDSERQIGVAQVSRVEPAAFTEVSALGVEEQRVNVIADLVPQAELPLSWGDGYRVDVHIGIWEDPQALKVPTGALFRCQDAWCVFTIREGKATQRSLQIGARNEQEAVVLQGLTAGDPVILYPSQQVESGMRVRQNNTTIEE